MEARSDSQKVVGVQIGRFAPYHWGHQLVTERMLANHGVENSLIMIGSSNVFNIRTPFTFEQRKALIQKVLGEKVRIMPLPDVNSELLVHAESTVPMWLESIRKVEREMGVKFRFYGGSEQDVRFFEREERDFINRETVGKGVNASDIRKHLLAENYEALKGLVDERIVADVIRYFRENLEKLLTNQ